jgi:hypothetical protein
MHLLMHLQAGRLAVPEFLGVLRNFWGRRDPR